MARLCVSYLTIATVLVHVLIGCHAHHAHAGQASACKHSLTTHPCSHAHSGDSAHVTECDEVSPSDGNENEEPHAPPFDSCDEGDCKVVFSPPVKLSTIQSIPNLPLADSLPLFSGGCGLSSRSSENRSWRLSASPPTQPLTQVWLL